MSRPFWQVELKVSLINGQSGTVHLEARDLVTLREVQEVFNRAVRMCETLKADPEEQPQRRPEFKVV